MMENESDNLYFASRFWGQEEENFDSGGLDRLVTHMRNGRASLRDLEAFLQDCSKIETDYAKQMGEKVQKFKSHKDAEDYQLLGKSISSMSSFIGEIGQLHEDLGKQYTNAASELSNRLAILKENAKEKDKEMKKITSERTDAKSKKDKMHKDHQRKVSENDAAKHDEHKLRDGGELAIPKAAKMKAWITSSQEDDVYNKEVQKAEEKVRSTQAAVDDALANYDTSVQELNQAQANWNRKYEDVCVSFQQDEEQRYKDVVNKLKLVLNKNLELGGQVKSKGDDPRDAVNECDKDEDIKKYIAANQTGEVRTGNIRPSIPVRTALFQNQTSTTSDWGDDNVYEFETKPEVKVGSRCRAFMGFDPAVDLSSASEDEIKFDQGDEATLLQAEGDWWLVRIGDKEGWVPGNHFEAI